MTAVVSSALLSSGSGACRAATARFMGGGSGGRGEDIVALTLARGLGSGEARVGRACGAGLVRARRRAGLLMAARRRSRQD